MKKVLAVLASSVLVLGLAAGCSSQTPTSTAPQGASSQSGGASTGKVYKIGITLKDLSDQFVKNIGDYMTQYAKNELNGKVQVDIQDAQGDVNKQISQVEAFIAQKDDAIVMVAQDAEGCGTAVDDAVAAKIPIIDCNTLTTNTNYTAYVGSNDVNAGKMQSEYLNPLLPQNAKVCYIMGPMGQSPQILRKQGIDENLFAKRKDIKILDSQTANWKRDQAMSLTESWLTKYGSQINAVIAQNDDMAMGALSAIEAKGLVGKILVMGVDGIPDALQAVKDGKMVGTVLQNSKAQATGSLDVALKAAQGQKVNKTYDVPFILVTKDNVDQYLSK